MSGAVLITTHRVVTIRLFTSRFTKAFDKAISMLDPKSAIFDWASE
jgi:hypothetical protein